MNYRVMMALRLNALACVLLVSGPLAARPRKPAVQPRAATSATTPLSKTGRKRLIDGYVARARKLRLHESRSWRRLVHYRKGLFGWVSEADNTAFFNSPKGKSNPAVELEATIRAVLRRGKSGKLRHPYCRFPARLAYLNAHLDFDFEKLGKRRCPEYRAFTSLLDARAITLIFSSYYLNNPASAFGHAFIRVNKRGRGHSGRGEDLLDYGIDYSATVDTDNSFIYALKGLTGMFRGTFRKMPYYLKVREYNDYESRDMWEYELDLTQSQVDTVVAHLWELGNTHFDYFYLTENCAYHVLAAIEIADPKLELLGHLRWPVIPADTVKALFKEKGLVKKITFRPSNRTTFLRRFETLAKEEQALVTIIAADPEASFPKHFTIDQKVRVLDAVLDYADFETARDLVNEDLSEEKTYKQALLERRAQLQVSSADLRPTPPWHEMPQMGHDTVRGGLGGGYTSAGGLFYAADLRLALHSLDDPARGYPEHMQIEFLPMSFRYGLETRSFTLEELSLVRIVSLTPMTRFAGDLSWTVRTGVTRIRDAGCDECMLALLSLGGGATVSAFDDGLVMYGLALNQVLGLGPVDGIEGLPLRLGLGALVGARLRFSSDLVTLLEGEPVWLPGQDPTFSWDARFVTRWHYSHDFAFAAELRSQRDAYSGRLISNIYF